MIVYVEDNPANQRLFQKFLSRWQIPHIICSTAEEGYQAIHEHQPSLIFMDVHLRSRVTGLDLTQRLRTEDITTPIIAITAFEYLADRDHAIEMGCNDYLAKPYSHEALHNMINKYLPGTIQ